MIEQHFQETFNQQPEEVAYAPGRVNLIGEHIDYNGGMVMPLGLPVGLSVALRRRDDSQIQIASDRFSGIAKIALGDPKADGWADYALGAVSLAVADGLLTGGVDMVITSTIPDGAGLSSSAALIVAILKAARDASGSTATNEEIAMLARRVENDYIGIPCGIMDQMAVAVASDGEAIALNTSDLSYTRLTIPDGYRIAVIHSGIQRKLSDGRYAKRKNECDEAATLIGNSNLCLLTKTQQQKAADLPSPLNQRVHHCVTEHQRVLKAVDALRDHNMHAFGALMNASHVSMRDDFDVSLPEIDTLVDGALSAGAIGARLTGGGFGGCIVACIKNEDYAGWEVKFLSAHKSAVIIC